MKLKIHAPKGHLKGTIHLPSSKSVSNRLLIIDALSRQKSEHDNLSGSDDTRALLEAIQIIENNQVSTIDVGHAGTTFRFLTAMLATKLDGEFILTGSQRMKERPCGVLVEALNSMGAKIQFLEKENYPPLKIFGSALSSEVNIRGNVSSQFISALMLIGPTLKNGLIINISSELVSKPYLLMTKTLMELCGAFVEMTETQIEIKPSIYHKIRYTVESDWSAAAFWYEMIAIGGGHIQLRGLQAQSFQGDAQLVSIYEKLGVSSAFNDDGVYIFRDESFKCPRVFEYDFTSCPDLVQAITCSCIALNISFKFNGLSTLKIKETDRVESLIKEFIKFGVKLEFDGEFMTYESSEIQSPNDIIATYQDHRMAMCMAPIALCVQGVCMEDPAVVSKSYPKFWKDLESVGFHLSASD